MKARKDLNIKDLNIPNLSIMCECGRDVSVTTALKNNLFSAFSYWRGFIQTNY